MTDSIALITPALLALVPVVIGLVQGIRTLGLPDRYAPVASIVLGILGAFVFPAVTIPLTILSGIVVGLSACGLYSGVRATAQV